MLRPGGGFVILPEPTGMDSIKLQISQKRPLQPDELERVEGALAAISATISGRGSVTLSATMPKDQFEKAFSKQLEGRSGFSLSQESAASLSKASARHRVTFA
jgi:hypothetical protein